MVAFLGVLFLVLFIPIYWLYDIGLPVVGVDGRLADGGPGPAVRHGHLARLRVVPGQLRALPRRQRPGRHRPAAQRPGQAVQRRSPPHGAPGTGHLNPNYIQNVLDGGRPLRVRRPEQPHARLAAAQRSAQLPPGPGDHRMDHGQQRHLVHLPAGRGGGCGRCTRAAAHLGQRLARPQLHAATRRDARARLLEGRLGRRWRCLPPPVAPVASPARPTTRAIIDVEGTRSAEWIDPATGTQITQIAVVPGRDHPVQGRRQQRRLRPQLPHRPWRPS